MSQSSARASPAAAPQPAIPVPANRVPPEDGASVVAGTAPATGARSAPLPPSGVPEPPVTEVGAWIAAWGELVVLALLAIIGAFFASAEASPGDYACGLTLALAAAALAFLRIKHRFDGVSGDWAGFLLVEDWANLILVIAVFVVLGLGGLFLAAGFQSGGLHSAGIALFLASGVFVFLNLKRVFDKLDRQS